MLTESEEVRFAKFAIQFHVIIRKCRGVSVMCMISKVPMSCVVVK